MRHLPKGSATEEAIAKEFGISKRTLHRRLREHDQSFRSVLGQVRRDLAERNAGKIQHLPGGAGKPVASGFGKSSWESVHELQPAAKKKPRQRAGFREHGVRVRSHSDPGLPG